MSDTSRLDLQLDERPGGAVAFFSASITGRSSTCLMAVTVFVAASVALVVSANSVNGFLGNGGIRLAAAPLRQSRAGRWLMKKYNGAIPLVRL
jgi:hypothetical protein